MCVAIFSRIKPLQVTILVTVMNFFNQFLLAENILENLNIPGLGIKSLQVFYLARLIDRDETWEYANGSGS